MARVVELATAINPVQRSQGDSATAKAAYRACCVIDCEREGRTHDYSRKQGLEASEIILPGNAPKWAKDRAKLWNGAEKAERNKDKRAKSEWKENAQVARDYMFGFPFELSREGRLRAARIIAGHLVETHGVAADFNIHEPGGDGDHRNYHCHLMWTTRRITAQGFGEKTREWDERPKEGSDESSLAKQFRAFVAKTLNDELAAEGKAHLVHIEHLSFKARGKPQKPTLHQGPAKTHMLRKRQAMARAAWLKEAAAAQRDRQIKELAALKGRQDFNLQGRLGELAERERRSIAAIQAELKAAHEADRPPSGLSRAFLWVTGRAGREAFDRNTRETLRNAAASQQIQSLKSAVQAERNAYVVEQGRERSAMTERHGREDQQLKQAAASRAQLDRAAEVAARHEAVREREHERGQERGGRGRGRELPGPTMH